jgi:hypothetical protein
MVFFTIPTQMTVKSKKNLVFFTILVPTTARKQGLLYFTWSSLLFLFQRQQESKVFLILSVPTTARKEGLL